MRRRRYGPRYGTALIPKLVLTQNGSPVASCQYMANMKKFEGGYPVTLSQTYKQADFNNILIHCTNMYKTDVVDPQLELQKKVMTSLAVYMICLFVGIMCMMIMCIPIFIFCLIFGIMYFMMTIGSIQQKSLKLFNDGCVKLQTWLDTKVNGDLKVAGLKWTVQKERVTTINGIVMQNQNPQNIQYLQNQLVMQQQLIAAQNAQVQQVQLQPQQVQVQQQPKQNYSYNYGVAHSSKKELSSLVARFKEIDTNGDGKLDKSEMTNAYMKMYNITKENATAMVNNLFAVADANGDGVLDYQEFAQAFQPAKAGKYV